MSIAIVDDPLGRRHLLEAQEDWRLMEIIRDWGIPIGCECGGGASSPMSDPRAPVQSPLDGAGGLRAAAALGAAAEAALNLRAGSHLRREGRHAPRHLKARCRSRRSCE
jgi:hypothetical protein